MFGSGEELLAGSSRAPWLIWIHLLVMLLLLLLCSFLFLFASDLAAGDRAGTASGASAAAALLASKPPRSDKHPLHAAATSPSCLRNNNNNNNKEEVEEERGNMAARTSRIAGEGILERENSVTYSTQGTFLEEIYNPCRLFRLAREVFLKCFGLDFTSEASSSREQSNHD